MLSEHSSLSNANGSRRRSALNHPVEASLPTSPMRFQRSLVGQVLLDQRHARAFTLFELHDDGGVAGAVENRKGPPAPGELQAAVFCDLAIVARELERAAGAGDMKMESAARLRIDIRLHDPTHVGPVNEPLRDRVRVDPGGKRLLDRERQHALEPEGLSTR